jgi:hypothetical protein
MKIKGQLPEQQEEPADEARDSREGKAHAKRDVARKKRHVEMQFLCVLTIRMYPWHRFMIHFLPSTCKETLPGKNVMYCRNAVFVLTIRIVTVHDTGFAYNSKFCSFEM